MNPVAIAAASLHKPSAAFGPAERIKSGLTNESWLVRDSEEAVVVRISNRETDTLQINRRSEAVILDVVAQAGIGVPVIACDPEQHVLVTKYISGRVWSIRDARMTDNLKRLAETLRTLHSLPVPAGVQAIDLLGIVRGYWHTLMARGLVAHAGSNKVRDRARQYISELQTDAHRCLCHNDVHHLNIIDDGTLRLVDWEYAGIGDPYFDLASVCCYHALSDAGRREWLRAYLNVDNALAFDRLQRMCWVFNYIRDLWFAVREME